MLAFQLSMRKGHENEEAAAYLIVAETMSRI